MMANNLNYRVIIVGGGIIGLTTACTLLKEYASIDNLQLTIISETFSPNTTGDISAGYWQPYGLNLNDQRMLKWARYSYEIFMEEYVSIKAARAGVIQLTSYSVFKQEDPQHVDDKDLSIEFPFLPLVRHYRRLSNTELHIFDHLAPVTGFVMSSVVVEVQRYLPELYRFLTQDRRVKFINKKILSLSELKDQADVVINCTGLGARYLVGDLAVRPARGQVIRIHAPWIKSMYYFDTKTEGVGYIIPQSDTIVLGGTFQMDDWSKKPTEEDTNFIRRICARILPALDGIKDSQVQVGLRPYRDGGVRLEHERTSDGMNVVHCYGHSGAGVTLSWGCAKDTIDIVKTLLPVNDPSSSELPTHEQLWRLIQ
ncbi:unnamed protein product [Adineta ricciae]|uniref:FAD dependent oxidoreductase domain-containing protein n=1 Tax=Adineta ricciae TaxID=249248 RepID=A0A813RA09_ADIRI|nr:unnamed protein product [Adineta ricciae]CAF1164700.1 unnamed protein product [Adineta ricciae]